jgi:hypothetical protein
MRFHELRILESKLFESNRGILGTVIDTQSGRGDSFTKEDGAEVRATNAWKFPQEETDLRYENKQPESEDEELIPAEDQFAEEIRKAIGLNINNVNWTGGQKPATGFAALVVELQSDKGKEYVGKYFRAKRSDGHIFWQVSHFIKDLNTIGIKLQSKKAATSKGTSGAINLGPKEVGVTDRVINLASLVSEVRKGVEANDKIPPQEKVVIAELVENLGGDPVTINPEYRANYEVQLGEVAAPLAITRGINVSGSIQEAENQLLNLIDPGTKFTSIQQVEYPDNIAEKLVDSYLITPNGSRIGVSSKDKKGGAAASMSSIIETIENKIDTIEERVPDFKSRYSQYLDWLDTIKKSTGKSVAYSLAAKMGIISADTAREAFEAMKETPGDAEKLREIDNGRFYDLTIGFEGYDPKTSHPMYKIHYHAAASLARIVANKFNEDQENVRRFFSTVLESSNMIQVLTSLKAKGDQGQFSDFKVIYPPVFEGSIKLEAGSYFFAQKPPQGFTFKIK